MASERSAGVLSLLQRYQGIVGLGLLLAVAAAIESSFFRTTNMANVLNQVAIPGIMAVGMTFVILTGGIDLSVGSTLALLNCVAATWLKDGSSLAATCSYVLFLGTLIGAALGGIIAFTRLQPFVVTLAGMVTIRGIAYVYTNNGNVSGLGEAMSALQRPILGVQLAIWLLVAITLVAAVVLRYMTFGRHVYAIGGNDLAARYSALPVDRTRIAVYAINGFCVAVAALLFTARGNNGDPSVGIGYELDAIAAAVVGGASLLGGYGSVLGSFVGAVFIGSLTVLMVLQGVNDKVAMGWKGVIILIAVYLQNLGRNRT